MHQLQDIKGLSLPCQTRACIGVIRTKPFASDGGGQGRRREGGGSLALGKDQPPLSYTGEGTEHRQGEASRDAGWTMPSVVTVREDFTSRKASQRHVNVMLS